MTITNSLMFKKSKFRLFGHDERTDDNDWVKSCMTWEVIIIIIIVC